MHSTKRRHLLTRHAVEHMRSHTRRYCQFAAMYANHYTSTRAHEHLKEPPRDHTIKVVVEKIERTNLHLAEGHSEIS